MPEPLESQERTFSGEKTSVSPGFQGEKSPPERSRSRPREITRQLIHLSGALFVLLLAQVTGREVASLAFFSVALTFLLYSLYILREENRFKKLLDSLDKKIRGRVLQFERPGVPLQGAFWFYAGCGLAFLFFPLPVATAACLILAVSDSLSTLVGFHFGKKKILGNKTLEGTATFFLSSLLIGFMLLPAGAPAAALAATAGELLPELAPGLRRRGLVDDNLIIPLLAGAAFLAFA